ncbi:hypothetical protein ACFLRF_01800 [Candidatus Altiarchaeota archaeon]
MKTITIDDNAHNALMWAKEKCKKEGIEKPSLSEAIRHMRSLIDSRHTSQKGET